MNEEKQVRFRNLDAETSSDEKELARKNGSKPTNGFRHGSPGQAVTTRRTSVAELSRMSATHINYCSRKYRIRKVLRKSLLVIFFVVYVVAPVFYWQCTWIRRHIIYLNVAFATPNLTNIENPVLYGNFSCARNIYLSPEKGIQLGTWHVLPESLFPSRCSAGAPKYLDEREFNDDKPVILHLHGSGGSRGSTHRINLIKILTNRTVDCHVVTMDYRGFGESTSAKPSVPTVSDDVREAYRWLRVDKNVSNDRIIIYGQSLGTGISIHLAHETQDMVVNRPDGSRVKLGSPAGIILEAPYTDIAEASRLHPYTFFHAYFPLFEPFFITPIRHSDTFWDSQSRIASLRAPVLILHAEDDDTIPYVLGKKLYELGKERRHPVKQPIQMVTYGRSLGYGHKKIYCDPGHEALIANFVHEHFKKSVYAEY